MRPWQRRAEPAASAAAAARRSVVPPLAHTAANAAVGQALVAQLAAAAAGDANPLALISPVGVVEINLHPVQFSGMNMAAGLGARPALASARARTPPPLTRPRGAGLALHWGSRCERARP